MLGKDLYPAVVSTDFERGLMNAIKDSFPGVQLKSCLFHFCQCTWRHIQENGKSFDFYKLIENIKSFLKIFFFVSINLGLVLLYNSDLIFRTNVRMLNALPLLPIDKIDAAYEQVKGRK